MNVLGADVARQCLEAGALDEVLTILAPVLLGDGTPPFAHPGGADLRRQRRRTLHRARLTGSSVPGAAGLP